MTFRQKYREIRKIWRKSVTQDIIESIIYLAKKVRSLDDRRKINMGYDALEKESEETRDDRNYVHILQRLGCKYQKNIYKRGVL